MSVSRILVVAVAGVLCAPAGVAAAGNLSSDRQVDFFASGTHQFYVWCPGTHDYMATARGTDAEDAQMKLYNTTKVSGRLAGMARSRGRRLILRTQRSTWTASLVYGNQRRTFDGTILSGIIPAHLA